MGAGCLLQTQKPPPGPRVSSARRGESSAEDGLSVVAAGQSVDTLGNGSDYGTDDKSKEFILSQTLKYRLEYRCDAKQSDGKPDDWQDWARYSDSPSSLTSSSGVDDEEINYQLKIASGNRQES